MAQMVYRRHRDADAEPAKPILPLGIGTFVRPRGKDDSVSRFASADMFSGIEVAMDPGWSNGMRSEFALASAASPSQEIEKMAS